MPGTTGRARRAARMAGAAVLVLAFVSFVVLVSGAAYLVWPR